MLFDLEELLAIGGEMDRVDFFALGDFMINSCLHWVDFMEPGTSG